MSRHAIETHQAISGCLPMPTLLRRFPEITSEHADRVRNEPARELAQKLLKARRVLGLRPRWTA